MNNSYPSGQGNSSNGSSGTPGGNSGSFVSRRNIQANPGQNGRGYTGPHSFDFDAMIQALRDLFAHDRQVASQSDSTRCGLCYLYYPVSELTYRDEGFYICQECAHNLGRQSLPMLRKQQKL